MQPKVQVPTFWAFTLFFIAGTSEKSATLDTIKQVPTASTLVEGTVLTVVVEEEQTNANSGATKSQEINPTE